MAALDAAGIEVARVATHQSAAREHGFGQRQQATSGDGARAIRNALARRNAFFGIALKVPADIGVGFEALKLLIGAEIWVGVVQAHHKAHHHFIAFSVVQK